MSRLRQLQDESADDITLDLLGGRRSVYADRITLAFTSRNRGLWRRQPLGHFTATLRTSPSGPPSYEIIFNDDDLRGTVTA